MKYNPEIHHRKSIRLKEFDYSKQGMYFITICTQDRKNLFWDVNKNSEKCMGGASPAHTIGNIICTFKSITTITCNKIQNTKGRNIWQRNYYEHIIRNEKELYKIIKYIEHNPYNWINDLNYIKD